MHTDLSTGYDFASRKMREADSSIARHDDILPSVLELGWKGRKALMTWNQPI
jgi:hypothetical protein